MTFKMGNLSNQKYRVCPRQDIETCVMHNWGTNCLSSMQVVKLKNYHKCLVLLYIASRDVLIWLGHGCCAMGRNVSLPGKFKLQ